MLKQNIQEQITKKEAELNILKEKLKKELESKNEVEWISIDKDFEVTKEVLHKGKSYNEIIPLKKPNEELLTLKQVATILENKELVKELKMDSKYSKNDDFFFKQPCETNKEKNFVAQFYSNSRRSGFDLVEDADVSWSVAGVRFVRKKRKNNGKN